MVVVVELDYTEQLSKCKYFIFSEHKENTPKNCK